MAQVVLAGACSPMAGAIPVGTLQAGGTLAPAQQRVAVAAGLGAGGVGWPEGGAGGALQLRQGLGEGKELQLGGQAVLHSCSGCDEDVRDGDHLSFSGRAGLKLAGNQHSAFVTGATLGGYPGGKAVGFDVGVVFDATSWLYGSLRAGVGLPIEHDDSFDENDEGMTAAPRTTWMALAFGAHGETLFFEAGVGVLGAGGESGAVGFVLAGVELGE